MIDRSHDMKKRQTKKNGKMTKAGGEILSALMEIKQALDDGVPLSERFTVRQVEVVDPGAYDAARICRTRAKLAVSQAVFARLVGVSTVLVQFWECGKRAPNAMARRVLDEINRDPKRWSRMLFPLPGPTRRVA
jgi:DNA-binding transcriptional regulator YiaG